MANEKTSKFTETLVSYAREHGEIENGASRKLRTSPAGTLLTRWSRRITMERAFEDGENT